MILAPQKQVDHAIRAFSIVARAVPGAKLDIYGKGKGLHDTVSLIEELGLTENVSIVGYVQADKIDAVYAKSLVCMMTSKCEGMPLAILESMVNETPYVSYNLKYGPSDVIADGKNGYIVPQEI